MNEHKDSEIDKSLTPLIAQTEYQLIEKDKNALVEKIEQLDAEIHSLETAYFNRSETKTDSYNAIRGWDGFLDAKLDGNNSGKEKKVPEGERYFSNSSMKSKYSSGKIVGQSAFDKDDSDTNGKGKAKNKSKRGKNNSNSGSSRTRKDGRKRKRY